MATLGRDPSTIHVLLGPMGESKLAEPVIPTDGGYLNRAKEYNRWAGAAPRDFLRFYTAEMAEPQNDILYAEEFLQGAQKMKRWPTNI